MQKPKRFFLPAERVEIAHWGIAALTCGALAVLAANLSFLVPSQSLSALHVPYRESGGFNQMRAQLAELEQDRNRIVGDYRALLARFNLLDDDGDEVIRRLAAVEMSLPLLIESLPLESDIDRSLLTASITEIAQEVYEVEGGTMVVRYSPLFDGVAAEPGEQPLPPPLPEAGPTVSDTAAPDLSLQGIAVGEPVGREELVTSYDDITAAAGTLLLGTSPLFASAEDGDRARIVLGPLPDLASAEAMCGRLTRLEFACDPAPYEGTPWPL